MTKQTRRKLNPAFKAKVALEAIKGQQTLAELAKKFEVSQVIVSRWKAEFLVTPDLYLTNKENRMNRM